MSLSRSPSSLVLAALLHVAMYRGSVGISKPSRFEPEPPARPYVLRLAVALIGGDDAAPRQFGWQVLVHGFYPDSVRLFSSGVLVHPEWVLTTAESVADFLSVTVSLGVIDKDSVEDSRQDIPALQVHLHPQWRGRAHWSDMQYNDIGLIRLATPAKLNERVQLAHLPAKKTYNGYRVVVSGWGLHHTDSGFRNQNRLKWMETKTISFTECYIKRFSVSDISGWVQTNHICAETHGLGPCSNDGGAPLLLLSEAGMRAVVLGLFSAPTVYGLSCYDNEYPAVFTRVSEHLDWIERASGVTSPSL